MLRIRWARNHLGWRHMEAARPNAAHLMLADWERRGLVTGVITQNVDLLHSKAGSRMVINLHGTYARVICLGCGSTMSRAALAEELHARNPGFLERAEPVGGIGVAPDADAMVSDTGSFRYVDCPQCGGMLKPDIVYFGEQVPRDQRDRLEGRLRKIEETVRAAEENEWRRTNPEARARAARTRALLERPDVDYVSIKVSSLVSQITTWDTAGTVDRVLERLRPLYRAAMARTPHAFVNLDMEEYRDLDLTLEVFTRLLSEPEFADLEAGIVLQAYLPDSAAARTSARTSAAGRIRSWPRV